MLVFSGIARNWLVRIFGRIEKMSKENKYFPLFMRKKAGFGSITVIVKAISTLTLQSADRLSV